MGSPHTRPALRPGCDLAALIAEIDPDVLAAAAEVDTSLIGLALERRPLERVEFAQQMLETLSRFRHVGPPRF